MNDNYIIPILVAGSLLLPMLMLFFTVFLVISKNSQRKLRLEKKEMEFQFEKQLLHTMLEVQEKGLNQLSQEIHDNIGQLLTGVHANLISLSNGGEIDTKQIIESAKLQVSKALKNLRNVSHILNSKYINKIGLEESIKKEIAYLGGSTNINFDVQVNCEIDKLSAEKELMVFRIAQEALTNIIKHSQATSVSIKLDYSSDEFAMQIADNGVGFNHVNDESVGIGMITMQQRAEVMNGSLMINSPNKSGTHIILKIPI